MMNQFDNQARDPASHIEEPSYLKSSTTTDPLRREAHMPGSIRRWWFGVCIAALLSLPLAWLLSYAAALPFFLGLFFFMLFGLIIGATAYRLSAPSRPYKTVPIIVGTTLLVTLVWGFSIVKEARDFPNDVARRTALRTRDIGDLSVAEFRTAIADDVRNFLKSRYGPVPEWSYFRWVLTNGELNPGDLATFDKKVPVPAAQTKGWWAFRAVASAALLAFGISSQTLLLRKARQNTETQNRED